MPFLVHLRASGTTHCVDITACAADATVADLVRALLDRFEGRAAGGTGARGGAAPPGVTVDGRPIDPATALAEARLTAGCTVAIGTHGGPAGVAAPSADDGEPGGAVLEVRVSGGLHAGRRAPLDRPVEIGRRPRGPNVLVVADPTVSRRHFTLEPGPGLREAPPTVRVADRRSTNGTWSEGVHLTAPADVEAGTELRCGASEITVALTGPRPAAACSPPVGQPGRATTAVNRPPRRTCRPPVEPLDAPAPPSAALRAIPLGLSATVLPALTGVVLMVAMHSVLWGLLALLGPLTMAGSTLEQRRHGRRRARTDRRRFDAELRDLAEVLGRAQDDERRRRRALLPDPAEVVARAHGRVATLWERRPAHDDFLHLRLGTGTVTWAPPVHVEARPHPEVQAVVEAATTLSRCPVGVDLSGGAIVGIVGPPSATRAVARSLLVQASALHGPADVPVAVCTHGGGLPAWEWTAWLPHARTGGDGPPRLAAAQAAVDLLDEITADPSAASPAEAVGVEAAGDGPVVLVVVDDVDLLAGPRAPARRLGRTGRSASAVVLAERAEQLPASCRAVVSVDEHGSGSVVVTDGGAAVGDLLAAGVDEPTARAVALRLAGLSDPEAGAQGEGLAPVVHLTDLLGLPAGEPAAWSERVVDQWAAARAVSPLASPLGRGTGGVLSVDLDRDGPHALVAGTTGAGKSELLRTWVAGLAARHPPEAVTFVLVDFKGGSAFDRCARLPHTVGVVTDLDGAVAARALRGLDRELRRRESLLRSEGCADLADLRRRSAVPGHAGTSPAPPRIVVVVDEFATMAAELPDVLDGLVSVAQRGRSLGLHLVLATQRPAGVVSDRIRANTSLRVALRLPDAADSLDVIDGPGAAAISRDRPGRALARFGPDELLAFQAAGLTNRRPAAGHAAVTLAAFPPSLDGGDPASPHEGEVGSGTATDLDGLVDAIDDACARTGRGRAAPLWCPPLPEVVTPADLDSRSPAPAGVVGVLLCDRADESGHDVSGWAPASGPLLVEGPAGSGTSTALRAVVATVAAGVSRPGVAWHVHCIDGPDGALAPLLEMPCVGNVVAVAETERQHRLLRLLDGELHRRQRRSATAPGPPILLAVDGLGPFLERWDDPLVAVVDVLGRLVNEGTAVGIHVAMTADRSGSLPSGWRGSVVDRWVLGTGEEGRARRPPGRVTVAPAGLEAQVVLVDPTLPPGSRCGEADDPAGASTSPARATGPPVVGVLPTDVTVADVSAASDATGPVWSLALGIGDRALVPVGLRLGPGGAAVVAGPPRSGRSSVLAALAESVRAARRPPGSPAVHVAVVQGRAAPGPSELQVADVRRHLSAGGEALLLVDDAEALADDGCVGALIGESHPCLRVVAATTPHALRSSYGHFVRELRRERTGVLLDADPDVDAELLGTHLPRRPPAPPAPGRGWLVVDGLAEMVQLAQAFPSK